MTVDVLNVGRGVIADVKKILRPTRLKLVNKEVIVEISFVYDGNWKCTSYSCDDFQDLYKENYHRFDFSTFDFHESKEYTIGKVLYSVDRWWADSEIKEKYKIIFSREFFDEINIVDYKNTILNVIKKVTNHGS